MAFCVPTPAALPPASLAGGDAARPGQPSSPERPSARHSAAPRGLDRHRMRGEGRASGVSWGAGLGKGGRGGNCVETYSKCRGAYSRYRESTHFPMLCIFDHTHQVGTSI